MGIIRPDTIYDSITSKVGIDVAKDGRSGVRYLSLQRVKAQYLQNNNNIDSL